MMQERWTSLWGHLYELRQTLIYSLLIIGIGFFVLLGFYEPIFKLLTLSSLNLSKDQLSRHRIYREQVTNPTDQPLLFELPDQAWILADLAPALEKDFHSYYRLDPGQSLLYEQPETSPLLILGPLDGLALVFKLSLWLSIALTAPLWGWYWLRFILPGLKEQERRLLVPFLIGSLISLSLGVAFAYYVTLPLATHYLTHLNLSIGQNAWSLNHYINYLMLVCLGHAIAAELGLLLLFLVHFRLLSPSWLIAKRRYMIVLAFILSALLTPPDVLTQVLLALPLIGLYEISIWYARWRSRDLLIT